MEEAGPTACGKYRRRVRPSLLRHYGTLGIALGTPLLLAGFVAMDGPHSVLEWLSSGFLCGGIAFCVYRASQIWVCIGFHWRPVVLLSAVVPVLFAAARLPEVPILPSGGPLVQLDIALRCSMALLISGILFHLQLASVAPTGAIDLRFPLAHGRFAIVEGGGTAVLNRHRAAPAQAFAIDIVALNDRGRRAEGIGPEALGAYEILDRPVVAPSDGIVLDIADGVPDTPIGSDNEASPTGNHVVLFCRVGGVGTTLLLAHLRPGSVAVRRGQRVRRGMPVGRVGNSGNSTEPHLHIHAVRGRETDLRGLLASAEAVPMTFGGRYLTRNAIVHVPEPG